MSDAFGQASGVTLHSKLTEGGRGFVSFEDSCLYGVLRPGYTASTSMDWMSLDLINTMCLQIAPGINFHNRWPLPWISDNVSETAPSNRAGNASE